MHETRRRSRSLFITLLVLVGLASSAAAPGKVAAAFTISLSSIASGLVSPTQVTNAGDGTNRLFVVEQRGTIRVIQNGVLQPGFFMDIRSLVADGGERGLLGVAFHPSFETNRYLYVYYTQNGGDILVQRFTTNAAGTDVNEATAWRIMLIEHSAATNHNGGGMAFNPKNGYLYIGVGDGGGSGDPGNDAQEKTTTFLGKILRVNVNGSGAGAYKRYSIPASNPFAGPITGHGEIWAYGLRNPWRLTFDRSTGHMWVGDVGQDKYEEIDREVVSSAGGRNYGWSTMEGKHCYKPSKCPMAGDTLPIAEYTHASGNCSITGGYVYRGPTQTNLIGQYVFADFCSGRIWTIPHAFTAITQRADTNQNITSFGESEDGELYAVALSGNVYRVLAN